MFFKEFPLLSNVNPDGTNSAVRDIIRRVTFSTDSYLNDSNYEYYTIQDGETPDSLAEKFYGDSQFHWVIILYNNLFDPFYSFPLSRNDIEDFINKKYDSDTLFVAPVGATAGPFFSSMTFDNGDVISTKGISGANDYYNEFEQRAKIKLFDNQMSKMQLSEQLGKFVVGETISTRRSVLDNWTADIIRVVGSKFAPHHFESNGKLLNPLASAPDENGDNQVAIGSTGANFAEGDNLVRYENTILHSYINDNSQTYVVTNEEHEYLLNQKRLNIRIPKGSVVSKLVEEFKEIIKV